MLLFLLLVLPPILLAGLAAAIMRRRYKGRYRFLLWLVPALVAFAGFLIGLTADLLLLAEVFRGIDGGGVGPT